MDCERLLNAKVGIREDFVDNRHRFVDVGGYVALTCYIREVIGDEMSEGLKVTGFAQGKPFVAVCFRGRLTQPDSAAKSSIRSTNWSSAWTTLIRLT